MRVGSDFAQGGHPNGGLRESPPRKRPAAASGCFFAFPVYGPQERVSNTDLAGVRSQLDLRGALSEAAFDAALRKASA
jgi:hypothetical protein